LSCCQKLDRVREPLLMKLARISQLRDLEHWLSARRCLLKNTMKSGTENTIKPELV